MCAQMAANEVDGPSLESSTQHFYTLLTLPTAGKGVLCWWGWPELERQLIREPPVPVQPLQLQEQRLQVWLLQTPEGVDGIWWWREHGGIFMGWGGVEDMVECDTAPLKSPYRPSTSNPVTTNSILCSPSISNCCASSHSELACFNKPNPWKRKKGLSQWPGLALERWKNS